jgi:hypothetical protein
MLYFSWKPPETNCATICLITATISLFKDIVAVIKQIVAQFVSGGFQEK